MWNLPLQSISLMPSFVLLLAGCPPPNAGQTEDGGISEGTADGGADCPSAWQSLGQHCPDDRLCLDQYRQRTAGYQSMFVDHEGLAWTVGAGGEVIRWSGGGAEITYVPDHPDLEAVFRAPDTGETWVVGALGTVARLGPCGFNTESISATTWRAIFGLSSQQIWIAGERGEISFFDGVSWSVQREAQGLFTLGDPPLSIEIYPKLTFIGGREGGIFASGVNTLLRLEGDYWEAIGSPIDADLSLGSIANAGDSGLWATGGLDVHRHSGTAWVRDAAGSDLVRNAIRTFATADGTVYILDGLSYAEDGSLISTRSPAGVWSLLPGQFPRFRDFGGRDGIEWVYRYDDVVVRIDADHTVSSDTYVTGFWEAPSGERWLSFALGTLMRRAVGGSWQVVRPYPEFGAASIDGIFDAGDVGIVYGRTFGIIDADDFTIIDSVPVSNVEGVFATGPADIWLATPEQTQVLHYDGATFEVFDLQLPDGEPSRALSVAGAGADNVWFEVEDSPEMGFVRFDGVGMVSIPGFPTQANRLQNLVVVAEDEAYARAFGVVWQWNGQDWNEIGEHEGRYMFQVEGRGVMFADEGCIYPPLGNEGGLADCFAARTWTGHPQIIDDGLWFPLEGGAARYQLP